MMVDGSTRFELVVLVARFFKKESTNYLSVLLNIILLLLVAVLLFIVEDVALHS
jgi:hypothetical protein